MESEERKEYSQEMQRLNRKEEKIKEALDSAQKNLEYSQKEANNHKRKSIIAFCAATALAITGGIYARQAIRIGNNPERELFISTGKYAENYQGNHPKDVLGYLNDIVKSYSKEISYKDTTLNGVMEIKDKKINPLSRLNFLKTMLENTNKLEDSLWYPWVYQQDVNYPFDSSIQEELQQIYSLMQESNVIEKDKLYQISPIVSKIKNLDEKLWEEFPPGAITGGDIERTLLEVNEFGRDLKELGERIPTRDNSEFCSLIAFIGSLISLGYGVGSAKDYNKSKKDVKDTVDVKEDLLKQEKIIQTDKRNAELKLQYQLNSEGKLSNKSE